MCQCECAERSGSELVQGARATKCFTTTQTEIMIVVDR